MTKRLLSRLAGSSFAHGALILMAVCLISPGAQGRILSNSGPVKKRARPAPAAKPAGRNAGLPPGIIVFEPLAAAGIAPGAEDVAAGWGDWLFLTVGGQPEFGQTPMIMSVYRAQRELNHSNNLRLGLDDARRAAKMTGANRVAIGTIRSVKPADFALTYTIYGAASGRALGKPFAIVGSAESIGKQLPGMAAEMGRRLGIASPNVPARVEATTAELGAVGRTFWTSKVLPADLKILEAAAPRVSLAAIPLLTRDRYVPNLRFRQNSTNLLTRLAPTNPLAWAHVAYISPATVMPHLPSLMALRRRYPHNYALAHTSVWMSRADKDLVAERRGVEAAIQNAPQNPEAWLALGQTLRLKASDLRKGRFAGDISEAEWKTLSAIYPVWAQSVLQAAELDPLHEDAWLRVATAATFYGDGALARKAFAKAEKLSHDQEEVYLWGFQMFDQKWDGTPEELNIVVERSVTANYRSVHAALSVVNDLKRLGRPSEVRALATRLLPLADENIRSMPDLSYVYSDKISLLETLDRAGDKRDEILAVSAAATSSLPEDSWVHLNYAQRLSQDRQQYPLSESEYRTVLRLDSENVDAMNGLAFLFARSNTKEAEALLKRAAALKPEHAYTHAQLGFLYTSVLHRKEEGITEYEKAVSCGQRDILTLTRLSRLLADNNQAAKAEPYALMSVRLFPEEVNAFNALAYVFLQQGKVEEATQAGQRAFAISEIDTEAHINFGLIQSARGDRREARREWERVAASKAGREQKERAQGYLAKYPEMIP